MQTARSIEARLPFGGRLVIAAAYHDLGYAPDLATTGFHPVDGALVARSDGLDDGIVEAVLHHSGARALAQRTRPELMPHYGPECRMMRSALSRALTFCDTHSGPRGETFTLSERIAEIRQRHAGNTPLLASLDQHLSDYEALEAEFLPLLR
ncbi:HD domain-containing protein [Tropicimonas aquimaris]|uniref:HD domain-containing protein n=1 Tax=Tropicimonas aquimaris TaxID=914152 RepID=A0ABW3IXF8_9RHOB